MNKKIIFILGIITFLLSSNVFGYSLDNQSSGNRFYWSLDNSDLINIDDAKDLTTNAITGVNAGVTTGAPGILNESFTDFNVSVKGLTIQNSSFYNVFGSESHTFNIWFNTSVLRGRTLLFYGFSGNGISYDIDVSGQLRAQTQCTGSGYLTGSGSAGSYNDTSWHMATFVLNLEDDVVEVWSDGVRDFNLSITGATNCSQSGETIGVGWRSQEMDEPFWGGLDEVGFWNYKISNGQISTLYNSGLGFNPFAPTPIITAVINFVAQTPSDITQSNILNTPLRIQYNYTNVTGLSEAYLNFTVNTTFERCLISVNGSCVQQTNEFKQKNNISKKGVGLHNFSLDETDVYGATYNFPQEETEKINHSVLLIDEVSNFIKIEMLNVSNKTSDNRFELMLSKENVLSSVANAYYCNNSYSTGLPSSSNNCVLFATYDENSFDHCHTEGGFNFSCHITKNFPLNTSTGELLGIKVSPTSQIIVNPTSVNGWNFHYIPNITRSGSSQTTINNGSSWIDLNGTFDSHLHQFSSEDTLYYQGCGNFSGTINCSDFQRDQINFEPVDPTPVIIINPTTGQNVNFSLNISYTASVVSNGTPIYNISLLNSSFGFVTSINDNNSNIWYDWRVYKENLSLTNYYIQVESKDTVNNLKSSSLSGLFSVITNAVINITAINNVSGAPISNFSGWIYDLNTSRNVSFSTTSGLANVGIIRENKYMIKISSGGTASDIKTVTAESGDVTEVIFYLQTFNSVNINIFYFDNLTLITKNVSVLAVAENINFSQQNTTNTGQILIDFLFPESYEIRFSGSGLNPISKFITVLNDSTQTINIYMTVNRTTELQVIEVIDTSNEFVEGAVVWLQQEKTTNGSLQWITIQEAITNAEGTTSVFVERDVTIFYRFAVIVNGVSVPILPNKNFFTTKTNFIPGVSETIQIVVELAAGGTDVIEDRVAVQTNLTYNNTHFIYNFIDGRNSIVGGKLKVFAKFINSSLEYTLVSEQTVTGSNGEISYRVTPINNSIYLAEGYVVYSSREELSDSLTKSFPTDEIVSFGIGMLLTFFVFISVVLLTVKFGVLWSSIASLLSIWVCSIFIFNSIPIGIINSLLAFVIVIFFNFKKKNT